MNIEQETYWIFRADCMSLVNTKIWSLDANSASTQFNLKVHYMTGDDQLNSERLWEPLQIWSHYFDITIFSVCTLFFLWNTTLHTFTWFTPCLHTVLSFTLMLIQFENWSGSTASGKYVSNLVSIEYILNLQVYVNLF